MRTLLKNATIINEGEQFIGSVLIEDKTILRIYRELPVETEEQTTSIDATGLWLMPGVIDDHVHFRDPGLTHKADIASESKAAVSGGVTAFMDMPNCVPQTTTLEAMADKWDTAAQKSLINYAFYFGATNNNVHLLRELDTTRVCGVKLFMGASTGNMLVDRTEALRKIFEEAGMLIATHCEDQHIIRENTRHYQSLYGEDPDIVFHPLIRSEEACYQSTRLAVNLAKETGARLHVLHLSTARELDLFEDKPLEQKQITAEACISHLFFYDEDYKRLGTRIKCNPSIKTLADREALRAALRTNRIDVIATDHAPHLLSEKAGGAQKAVSGMPAIQFSVITMLELAKQGVLSLPTVIEKMCHAPARLFNIEKRGFIREGYFADLVLIDPNQHWTVQTEDIYSKCGWSPLEGQAFSHRVVMTFVNGNLVYNRGQFHTEHKGDALRFNR